ncbi:MAG: DndE family protein [Verrucomicrobiales bacterium]
MKPPVDSVKVSSKGREILIQAKRHTGLKQWNELLRWAFCLSLANPDRPQILRKMDTGIDSIEWQTFAGSSSETYAAAFWLRAMQDRIKLDDQLAVTAYFRSHIERGIASLRGIKNFKHLLHLVSQMQEDEIIFSKQD